MVVQFDSLDPQKLTHLLTKTLTHVRFDMYTDHFLINFAGSFATSAG